jgi:hypothetical protein
MTSIIRMVASATAAAVVALVPAGAAVASTSTYQDPSRDSTANSDIRSVTVTNSAADDQLVVRVRLDRVVLASSVTVYVDRARRNPGPELRMVAAPDSEWALYRVDRWGQRGKPITTCGRVRYSESAKPVALWRTSRTCLHLKGSVRVAVKLAGPGRAGGTDWAPAARTFYPWVTARW